MSDIAQWFKSLPLFTRHWLGFTIILTLIGRFGLVDPRSMVLINEAFINRFQIWRPFTALFYYPLSPSTGFHFLLNCYFLINYSQMLEKGQYDNRPADYFFLLIFNWFICVLIAILVELPLLMDPMVLSLVYIWCQLNKDVIVNFWFGSRFKAMYLPWVLFGFNMIISNGGGLMELVGILVGHLYYFLMYKYPQELGGPTLISTPSILYRYFPSGRNYVHSFGEAPQGGTVAPEATGPRRHQWGRGHILGDH